MASTVKEDCVEENGSMVRCALPSTTQPPAQPADGPSSAAAAGGAVPGASPIRSTSTPYSRLITKMTRPAGDSGGPSSSSRVGPEPASAQEARRQHAASASDVSSESSDGAAAKEVARMEPSETSKSSSPDDEPMIKKKTSNGEQVGSMAEPRPPQWIEEEAEMSGQASGLEALYRSISSRSVTFSDIQASSIHDDASSHTGQTRPGAVSVQGPGFNSESSQQLWQEASGVGSEHTDDSVRPVIQARLVSQPSLRPSAVRAEKLFCGINFGNWKLRMIFMIVGLMIVGFAAGIGLAQSNCQCDHPTPNSPTLAPSSGGGDGGRSRIMMGDDLRLLELLQENERLREEISRLRHESKDQV